MADWPVKPVGSAYVGIVDLSPGYEVSAAASLHLQGSGSTLQTVSDANITFTINIEYEDGWWISGLGYFSAELFKIAGDGTEQSVDYENAYLPSDQKKRNGHWWGTLTLQVTMTDPIENYKIHLHCNAQGGPEIGYTGSDDTRYYIAIQGVGFIGDFSLDFVPVTIVYCPPGQDMTNSLSQTRSFGTKFTLGNSSSFQSNTKVSVTVDMLGLIGEGVGFSNSQSVSNQATSGVQVSHFRSTVVTADNQRAIGRAYWGPLSDIFVIMVNPSFSVSKRADGTLFYCVKDIEQIVLIPARKLLRPENDPIASAIPSDARQQLLQLDPFITNLGLFFPDTGADLSQAADPFADPSANNRATLLGRWWVDVGTEINYSLGEQVQILTTETNQVNYTSAVTVNASAGVNYDDIKAALGLGQGKSTNVGLQSSKENDAGYTESAACFIIRNQNDQDLDGIDLYFDKIFSTFMFRRLKGSPLDGGGQGGTTGTAPTGTAPTGTAPTGTAPTGTAPTGTAPTGTAGGAMADSKGGGRRRSVGRGILSGRVTNWKGVFLRGLQVYLTGSDGSECQTSTGSDGRYSFANLKTGDYTLVAGDQHRKITIAADCSPVNPARVDLTKVRRVLNLHTAPVWEVADGLGLSSDTVHKIGSQLDKISREEHLAKAVGADAATLARWKRAVVFAWPGVPGVNAQAAATPVSKPQKPPSHRRGKDGKARPTHNKRRK